MEYEWCLQNQDLDESEDELEDKVGPPPGAGSPEVELRSLTSCVLQPIPHRREDRPISCFVPGTGPGLASVARDAAGLARDRKRPQVPSVMISNETYGTMLELKLPPAGPTPPLPPRDPSRSTGRPRSSSDPPDPRPSERNSSVYGKCPSGSSGPPEPDQDYGHVF